MKKNWKMNILITLIGMTISVGGRWFCLQNGGLPLYLHYIGIMIASYYGGIVSGIITVASATFFGVASGVCVKNISLAREISFVIPMLFTAWLFGRSARNGKALESVYKAISMYSLVAVVRGVVMIAVNGFFYEGYTGLEMCDVSIAYMDFIHIGTFFKYTLPSLIAACLDSFVTIIVVFCIVRIVKVIGSLRKKMRSADTAVCLLLGVIAASLFCFPLEAQAASGDNFVQRIYSSSDGLLGGAANAIAQTEDGCIWVATYGGLYKFNGTEFVMVRDIPAARSCSALYVDNEDNLWIATNGTGLVVRTKDERIFELTDEDGLPSNAIRSIMQVGEETYYVGTVNEMVVIHFDGSVLQLVDTIPDVLYAKNQTITPEGAVLATTNAGEVFLIQDGKVCDVFSSEEVINGTWVVSGSEVYLAGANANLYRANVQNGTFVIKETRHIEGIDSLKNILVSQDQIMYLAGNNGVGYIDKNEVFHLVNSGDFNSSIDKIMEDYQANIWFTSYRCGLLELSPSSFSNLFDICNVEKKGTNTVKLWNGHLYVGADDGLYILDEERSCSVESPYTELFQGKYVRALNVDSQNNLWVATDTEGFYEIVSEDEIYNYSPENGLPSKRARCTIELSDGSIAASTYSGISFIRNHEIVSTLKNNEEMKPAYALCLLAVDEHTIFAGTNGDGICIIKDGQVETYITHQDGLPSGVILNMYKDISGDGYFVLSGSGLCYMYPDYSIREFEEFPFYNNTDLFQTTKNDVVVLSTAGIYIVNYDELMSFGPMNVHHLDEKMGLPGSVASNARNYMTDDDILYFAGNTGIYKLDCGDYALDVDSYKINMKSVLLDKTKSDATVCREIFVPAGTKKVTLALELYNYTTTDPYIRFYLTGVDDEPSMVLASELQEISYFDIPSGIHYFVVEVLDSADQTSVLESYTYIVEKSKEAYEATAFITFFRLGVALVALTLVWIVTNIPLTIMHNRTENELSKKEVERKTTEKMLDKMIKTLASSIDAKDEYTHGHSERVAKYALKLAQAMGMSSQECKEVFYAGLLHDVGKIAIPDQIINKPGKLTDEEFAVIKSHPGRGSQILSQVEDMPYLSVGAKYHHEKYDGFGYPCRAKGEEIPLLARIIAVADSYDAMTSKRSYRDILKQSIVKQEIWKGIGTQFDPVIAKHMIALIDADVNYDMREKDDEKYETINEIQTNEFWEDYNAISKISEEKVMSAPDIKYFGEFICTTDQWTKPVRITEIAAEETKVKFISKTDEDAEYIWNVPSLFLYTSDDGEPVGVNYRELAVFRCAGYSWKVGDTVSEEDNLIRKEAFVDWKNWLSKNKEGLEYRIAVQREKNVISLLIENELIDLTGKVELPGDYKAPLYVSVSGEKCIIADIRVTTD